MVKKWDIDKFINVTNWELFIPIAPVPKSYRAFGGRFVLSDETREFQEQVRAFVEPHAPKKAMDGYLGFQITYYLERKQSQKNEIFPATKPDLDNLIKSTLDSLQNAKVFIQDSRFVEGFAKKLFKGGYQAQGTIQAGIRVRIYTVEAL